MRRPPAASGPTHVFLAVCDHFEPLHDTDKTGAVSRVERWAEDFPRLIEPFRDHGGRSPKHTFFYPVEQYDPDLLAPLAGLCHATGSEVEIHLHHDRDNPAGFREALERGKEDLARHGLLARDRDGSIRFAFIHGNWALNNTHPEGRGCGVDEEIGILRASGLLRRLHDALGPSPTQSRVVNRIVYLADLPRRAPYDASIEAEVGHAPPLRDDPRRSSPSRSPRLELEAAQMGLLPRIENGDLTGANPPTLLRLRLAAGLRVSVTGNPGWVFVKWHTHGGIEPNSGTLLGEPMRRFPREPRPSRRPPHPLRHRPRDGEPRPRRRRRPRRRSRAVPGLPVSSGNGARSARVLTSRYLSPMPETLAGAGLNHEWRGPARVVSGSKRALLGWDRTNDLVPATPCKYDTYKDYGILKR